MRFTSDYHRLTSPFRSLGAICLALVLLGSATAAAETESLASGELGVYGTTTSGDYQATHAADGNLQKIAEAKDAAGQYRLEWTWQFTAPPGSSHQLRLRGQATNSKHGMDHYEIQVGGGVAGWTTIGTVTQTTMTDYLWDIPAELVSPGLAIRAVDDNQTDDARRSNQLWIDQMVVIGSGMPPSPLGAPSDLTATPVPETSIALDWVDNATGEDGFYLERQIGAGDFALLATLGANATDYLDTGLEPAETYGYRVRAFDEFIESAYSNTASASPNGGTGGPGGGATGPQTDKVIGGYYPSWAIYNARKYWISHIPFERLTHIYYAFANIDAASNSVIIGDSFAEETNRKDPETDNGLPAGNLYQLTHFRDVGHNGPAQEHLKVIISVGGWTWSDDFSTIALTPESRWAFAESLKNFVQTYDLDGADIDWEYPTGNPADCGEAGNTCRPEDPINHALLLLAARAKLDELGPGKELSIAMPADPAKIARIMPPMVDNQILMDAGALVIMRDPVTADELALDPGTTAMDALNYLHVMAYEMAGAGWEDTTRHHAPLYGYEGPSGDPAALDPTKAHLLRFNSHHAVQAYRYVHDDYETPDFDPDSPVLDPVHGVAEIPANKLVLGLPMFGRAFGSVDPGAWDGYDGLFQYTDSSVRRRTPKGTYDGGKWGNTGVFAYWDILLNHGGDAADPGTNLWRVVEPQPDGRSYGPYTLEGDLFIGFDDLVAVEEKMGYVVDQGLAGTMFWDLPGDVSQSLIDQGVAGAAAAYPSKSLIERMTTTLETLSPAP